METRSNRYKKFCEDHEIYEGSIVVDDYVNDADENLKCTFCKKRFEVYSRVCECSCYSAYNRDDLKFFLVCCKCLMELEISCDKYFA